MVTKKDNWLGKAGKFRTDYRRTSEASPFFEFSSPVMASNGTWILDIGEEDGRAKKHLPMSNIRIVNNSNQNIAFYPNQSQEAINVPSGTIISFDKMSIPALQSCKFTNLGSSSTTAGEIRVSVWREGIEIDGAFQRMHKAFYERFLFPSRDFRNVI